MSDRNAGTRVAVVAAYQSASTIESTVTAVAGLVDRVVVVDDGSTDGTAEAAAKAGADVVILERNRGKGAALGAGVAAAPEAALYLLVDADTKETAAHTAPLVAAVERGEADLAVGVLPAADGKGGWGRVKGLAQWGIRAATGFTAEAPLSGQRAVRGDLLRSLMPFAARFGVETGMTVDALRSGATVVEVEVEMDHRHTGRRIPGIVHRTRQGTDVLRALLPRLVSQPVRAAAAIGAGIVVALVLALLGSASVPPSGEPIGPAERVVVVAMPDLRWEDIDRLPALKAFAGNGGAAANATVGTPQDEPTASAMWATAGAGDRMAGLGDRPVPPPPDDEPLRVTAMTPVLAAQEGRHASASPGALGEALERARVSTGLVGPPGSPVGLLVADKDGRTGFAATAESGRPAEPALSMLRRGAGVVAIDATRLPAAELDAAVARLVDGAGPGTLVMAIAGSSAAQGFQLEPIMIAGPGARSGTLASPTTRRRALVALVDLAPTVLDALSVPPPGEMVGRALRRTGEAPDVASLGRARRDSDVRTRTWLGLSVGIGIAAGLVLLASLVPTLRRQRVLHYFSLMWASWPLACLLVDAVPRVSALGSLKVGMATVLGATAAAALAGRGRLTMPALAWIAGATALVYVADLATGADLQFNSTVGVAAATTSRFTGLPNTGFAAFAAALVVAVAALRRETGISRTTVGVLFSVAVFVVAWPTLGGDAGGLVTLVPVLFVLWVKLTGSLPWKQLAAAAAGVLLAAAAVGIVDLARPDDERTHLGRFLAGDTDVGTTIARRVDGNLASYTLFPVILVGLTFVLGFLLLTGRWTSLFPRGSAERAAAGAVIAIALIGNVVNDSGAINTAVSMLFLIPLIYVAGDEHERPRVTIKAAR